MTNVPCSVCQWRVWWKEGRKMWEKWRNQALKAQQKVEHLEKIHITKDREREREILGVLPAKSRLCPGNDGWALKLAWLTIMLVTQYPFPIVAVHLSSRFPDRKCFGSTWNLSPRTEVSSPSCSDIGRYSIKSPKSAWFGFFPSPKYTKGK